MKHSYLAIPLFSMALCLGVSAPAFSEVRVTQLAPEQALDVGTTTNENELLFAYDLRSSNDWGPDIVEESLLFPGFKSFETWNVGDNTNETIIYKSQSAFIVNKGLSQIDKARLTTTDFLNSIDPGFKHAEVSAEEVNNAYVTEIQNGYASAKTVLDSRLKRRSITQKVYDEQLAKINQQLEINLSKQWCLDADMTCIKSQTLPFSLTLKGFIGLANAAGQSFPDTLESYSVVKLVQEELASLDANYGLVQTAVVSNKTIVSMRNVILFKELSPTQTLVKINVTIVFEKDDLDKIPFNGAYDFLIGNSWMTSDEGLEMGLPALNQKLALDLKAAL